MKTTLISMAIGMVIVAQAAPVERRAAGVFGLTSHGLNLFGGAIDLDAAPPAPVSDDAYAPPAQLSRRSGVLEANGQEIAVLDPAVKLSGQGATVLGEDLTGLVKRSGLVGAHPANLNVLDGAVVDLGAETAAEQGGSGDFDLLGGLLKRDEPEGSASGGGQGSAGAGNDMEDLMEKRYYPGFEGGMGYGGMGSPYGMAGAGAGMGGLSALGMEMEMAEMNDAFDKRDNVVEKRDEDYPMGMGMGMGMGAYGYGRGMGMGMGMGAGMGVDMDDLMEKREFMQKRAEHESNAADGAGDEANTPDRPGKAPSGLSAEELDDFLTKRQQPRPVVNVGAAHQDKRDTYVTSHRVSPSYGARYTVGNPMYGAAAMGYGMGMMNPDEVYDSID